MDPSAIVGEAIAGRQATVRRQLMLMAGSVQEKTFDLADLLFEAQEHRYFLQWGFESLGDYGAVELGLKERKCYYLARITRVCREVGLKRPDYEPAGTSKLRTITTLDTKEFYFNRETQQNEPMAEHIVDLVASAPDMTVDEVEEAVKALKGQTGENAPVIRSYSVTRSCWEHTVKPAFEKIRRRLGSQGRDEEGKAKEYSDGVCIEMACAEINADPGFDIEPDESKVQIEIPQEEI